MPTLYLDKHADKTPQNEMVAERANNLANARYRIVNKELINTIEHYTGSFVLTMQMWKVIIILRSAKKYKKD